MNNIRSSNTSCEGLQPVSVLVERHEITDDGSAQLLELRSEEGPVYLRPSGWQKFWLQRAFRHFRVLPPQLLSARNQRRITELLKTSVVTPERPVASSEVFGIVAQVHGKMPVGMPAPMAEAKAVQPVVLVAQKSRQETPKYSVTSAKPAVRVQPSVQPALQQSILPGDGQNDGLWQWIVAGAAAAICIPVIMASVYGLSMLSSQPEVSVRPSVRATQPVSVQAATPPVAPVSVAIPERHKHHLAARPALTETPASPDLTQALPEHRFVSELPPGHFAYPSVTSGGLAGEVRLKATIAADGSVERVTVLSGNPKLAEAATRAVRRWHYSLNGEPVAAETEIKMKFFGSDAVSIASVAGPAS